MPDFFIHNFASDTAGAIVEMIKKEPQDSLSSTIRLQAMAIIIELSKKHVVKAMGSHQRWVLLRTFLKSVFSLPLLMTLQVQGVIRGISGQYTKVLFIETLQTLNEMLQSLILENPVPAELERILQLMDSWMQSREACRWERAVWSSIMLLNFVATEVKLDLHSWTERMWNGLNRGTRNFWLLGAPLWFATAPPGSQSSLESISTQERGQISF
ncbi:maestro heat-like repeat-containing protein family member 7 [Malaclemys terrapin pileata]|uniref:maestro heat-like repeat-containing protein family member 7 n=1 Tax=Malaclemys terrapin pileata TaxID=2991368 RepID=UPI0023A85137|nr:maestro heat-like repeat-containing protein family member 7 [Malaclemys terrapin pileata]